MATASPFKLVSKLFFVVFIIISTIVSYQYLNNYKSYSVFEFEQLYTFLKKKSAPQQQAMLRKKVENPTKYYNSMLAYFSDKFAGVRFDYKLHKKH